MAICLVGTGQLARQRSTSSIHQYEDVLTSRLPYILPLRAGGDSVGRELDALLLVAVLSLVAAPAFADQTGGTRKPKRRAQRAAADRPRGPPRLVALVRTARSRPASSWPVQWHRHHQVRALPYSISKSCSMKQREMELYMDPPGFFH